MLGALMVVACAIAQLIVGPRIARLRAEISAPIESLPIDDARRMMFGRLHGVSIAWLGVAMLAAVVALVLCARSLDTRASGT
jgi:predicted RND superfamily exporter protein